MINNEQHSANLAYVAKTLTDKPVTADLFKQILAFNAHNFLDEAAAKDIYYQDY